MGPLHHYILYQKGEVILIFSKSNVVNALVVYNISYPSKGKNIDAFLANTLKGLLAFVTSTKHTV
jgi:hypothetical protein